MFFFILCLRGGGVWGSGPQTDKHLPQMQICKYVLFIVDGRLSLEVLTSMYENVDAVVDQPASTLWHCLFRQFPEAKVHVTCDSVVDQPASTLWHCLFKQFPEAKVHVTV